MTINELAVAYKSGQFLSNQDKETLYWAAKEAYYNESQILEDLEFDTLEKELGLENKSSIGTKHNPTYTIEHPFIMGSLSKVQVHEKSGITDWDLYTYEVKNYVADYSLIITPKYDGCSFECIVNNREIVSVSSRGDGYWGKDYKEHLNDKLVSTFRDLSDTEEIIFRGEVLVDKNVFAKKYSRDVDPEGYKNPRAFVSGILNRDYDSKDKKFLEMLSDLSIVIYDCRVNNEGNWIDVDWTDYKDQINPGCLPQFYITTDNLEFEKIYSKFEEYRNNKCRYPLDGFVIKPVARQRINNLTDPRPSDCVAIKFKPMLQETTVRDIKWYLGKTGEYTPVIITDPVNMDGKDIKRASGSNYGNLVDQKISVGTKVILSLAGDIIPFIYKVTDTSEFSENKLCLPENTELDGGHLMAIMTDEEKAASELKFSIMTLNIPGMGESGANAVVEYEKTICAGDEFFDEPSKPVPTNILMLDETDIEFAIGGKNGSKVAKAYKDIVSNLTLDLVIRTCNFRFCGAKVAEQVANYLLDKSYDFTSMASEGYMWAFHKNSVEYKKLENIMSKLGLDFEYFKKNTSSSVSEDKIKVILTGEPNNYSTKSEFMRCHPEYVETTKWKEVQIVFTNSLDSNTGKMKKAREKGVEIRVY